LLVGGDGGSGGSSGGYTHWFFLAKTEEETWGKREGGEREAASWGVCFLYRLFFNEMFLDDIWNP